MQRICITRCVAPCKYLVSKVKTCNTMVQGMAGTRTVAGHKVSIVTIDSGDGGNAAEHRTCTVHRLHCLVSIV